jgi:hypothetical protein
MTMVKAKKHYEASFKHGIQMVYSLSNYLLTN